MRTIARPEKVIIFYNHKYPGECTLPAVDSLCERGCSGLLLLEDLREQKRTRLQEITQLLGVYGCASTAEMKDAFKQRFGKMACSILSTSNDIVEFGKALGLTESRLLYENTTATDVQQLMSNVDCLLVDATMEDCAKAWSWVDTAVAFLLEEPYLLKCVMTPSRTPVTQKTPIWEPQQSYTVKGGKTVGVEELPLLYSYYHAGSTRLDKVTKFRSEEVGEWGCNGKILAWHFLAEIGSKLGHVPKYGA